ncbi:CYTH domain-containing protein [Dyella sp.]|uniref:CYTH domain-containing protein n=1 Tax=Dyella sp. TaxID=1869338 RepID=UPI002ED53739
MGVEIERKFLLVNDDWRGSVSHSQSMAQGYLVGAAAIERGDALASVRVRLAGNLAWLNIKSAELGIERAEYEYPLPLDDARQMLARLCDGVVEKVRHHVDVDGTLFEIDEFTGKNHGLVVAEVELDHADAPFPRPAWLGGEVSSLVRYYNVHLIEYPYSQWTEAERKGVDAC